jgi:hypothetical protein
MTVAGMPLMFWIGLVALVGGVIILLGRGDSEGGVYARRISGIMIAALGIFLMIFANGLAPAAEARDRMELSQ